MPRVTFSNEQKSAVVETGTTILEAARSAKIVIEAPCNAIGNCGKCKVRIAEAEQLNNINIFETGCNISAEERRQGFVLACQATIKGDITVEIKDYDGENNSLNILSSGNSFAYERSPHIQKKFDSSDSTTSIYGGDILLGREAGDTTNNIYAIALDIGTTTIVASLIDLLTGAELASDSGLNPQAVYAQDVLSRIHFASNQKGLHTLHHSFIDFLNSMIDTITTEKNIEKTTIYEIVFSGNTAMLHLAANINPYSLGQYPYTPQLWGGSYINTRELGITVSDFGIVYLPPIISAYIGADITSGILVSRLDEIKETVLFIDIGTNGEMALVKDSRLVAASTAAGPAFEGMNISCGMRAGKGAIESFCINDDGIFSYRTIGNSAAIGICGSGLLDIAGELVRLGVIGASGRFVPPEAGTYSEHLKKCMGERNGRKVFFITETVYLEQKDVRQIQLAKSAIRSGIEMLLSQFNLQPDNVDAVDIAGSFGYHLQTASLINIRLLPKEFAQKVRFTGNTSLTGATAFLLNANFRIKMKELVKKIKTVDLARDDGFEDMFIKYMVF